MNRSVLAGLTALAVLISGASGADVPHEGESGLRPPESLFHGSALPAVTGSSPWDATAEQIDAVQLVSLRTAAAGPCCPPGASCPEVSCGSTCSYGECGCGVDSDCGHTWFDGTDCSHQDGWLCSDEPLLHDLRNRPLFGDLKYSAGGELRYRYMDERNRLRPAGTVRNTYDLWRIAPFVEIGNDSVTAYVQAIDASIFDNEVAPLPIDENRADLLQYYIDVNLWDLDDGTLRFRVGRQFLKYGSQILVSPLPWANTYRNFEGFRLYSQSATWDIDAFAVRPVNGAAVASQFRPTSFDEPDASVWFSGVYASRKNIAKGAIDMYWLWNKEEEALAARHDGSRHTIGARYWGSQPIPDALPTAATWLWDLEGGWQLGEDNFVAGPDRDVSAGYASAIGALTFTELPGTPTLKGLFWWGSGDGSPGSGTISTLTTLYPFGHFYWGLIDNFNGANLLDYSVQVSVKPHKTLTLLTAWHWFDKASRGDFIYNIAGAPLGGPTSSRNIGHELDLVATYAVNANVSVELGYLWFWYGDAVDEQPGLRRDDAHELYFMTTWGL